MSKLSEIMSPNWAEGGRVHNWRSHVPEHVRKIWMTFTDGQRHALYQWADDLADQEDWD